MVRASNPRCQAAGTGGAIGVFTAPGGAHLLSLRADDGARVAAQFPRRDAGERTIVIFRGNGGAELEGASAGLAGQEGPLTPRPTRVAVRVAGS